MILSKAANQFPSTEKYIYRDFSNLQPFLPLATTHTIVLNSAPLVLLALPPPPGNSEVITALQRSQAPGTAHPNWSLSTV